MLGQFSSVPQPIYVIMTRRTSYRPSKSAAVLSGSTYRMHQTSSASRLFVLAPLRAFCAAPATATRIRKLGNPKAGNVLTGLTPSRIAERGAVPVNLCRRAGCPLLPWAGPTVV
jgi:hypothetical protein